MAAFLVLVVDLSRWYILYFVDIISKRTSLHPGRCGVLNRRTRPKSRATAEACVVLRSGFLVFSCVSLCCTDILKALHIFVSKL